MAEARRQTESIVRLFMFNSTDDPISGGVDKSGKMNGRLTKAGIAPGREYPL